MVRQKMAPSSNTTEGNLNGFRLGGWRFGEKHVIGADADAAGVERRPLLVRWVVFRCEAWGVYVEWKQFPETTR